MTEKQKKLEFFNRKARFDYQIIESFEVGIVLLGSEIKALRAGKVNLTGSYARILGNELWWVGGEIRTEGADPTHSRKLLVHHEQLNRLAGLTKEKGLTLLPLKIYLKKGRAKMELGVGRGLKKYDKREIEKKRDQEREAAGRIKQR